MTTLDYIPLPAYEIEDKSPSSKAMAQEPIAEPHHVVTETAQSVNQQPTNESNDRSENILSDTADSNFGVIYKYLKTLLRSTVVEAYGKIRNQERFQNNDPLKMLSAVYGIGGHWLVKHTTGSLMIIIFISSFLFRYGAAGWILVNRLISSERKNEYILIVVSFFSYIMEMYYYEKVVEPILNGTREI